MTEIEIEFDDEGELQTCVRMLRWSDDRLRARLEQFKEPAHARYYAMFGSTPDHFMISHKILGDGDAD